MSNEIIYPRLSAADVARIAEVDRTNATPTAPEVDRRGSRYLDAKPTVANDSLTGPEVSVT